MSLSTFCGQRGIPPHRRCQSLTCACECGHPWREAETVVSQGVSEVRGGKIGAESGAESVRTRPAPTDHPAKDVTG